MNSRYLVATQLISFANLERDSARLSYREIFATVISVLFSVMLCAVVYGQKAQRPRGADAIEEHRPRMVYLQNTSVRVGVDLGLGGAITYLAPVATKVNMVNNYDWGRQVQMSYFSGPVPYEERGRKPATHWRHIGWNPIQVGDDFGNPSQVVAFRQGRDSMYVKCVPQQWPLNNVPGECTFESWLTLDGRAVHVRCRLTNNRSDKTQYRARDQELPAVYANAPYYRLISYTGNQPFKNAPLERIAKSSNPNFPWTYWRATENWAALVNDDDFGVGVWNPGCHRFLGGFAGKPGQGGEKDNPTGYMAPTRREIIDHNLVHDYEYTLIVGSLKEIRRFVYRNRERSDQVDFDFTRGRHGWWYQNMKDDGPPTDKGVRLHCDQVDPQLLNTFLFWDANKCTQLVLRAAFFTQESTGHVFFQRWGQRGFPGTQVVPFKVVPDGKVREYRIPLDGHPDYRGAMTALRVDPIGGGKPGDTVQLLHLSLAPAGESSVND